MGEGRSAPAQFARHIPAARLDVPAGRQVRPGLGQEHQPLERFDEFADEWAAQCPEIIRLWRNAWSEFVRSSTTSTC